MKRVILILILGVALLTGCAPVKVAPQAVYTLSSQTGSLPKTHRASATLVVTQPTAVSAIAADNMIYTKVPYQLQSFADSRWAAPPAEMLLPALADELRASAYFHAVVIPPFVGVSDYRLDTNLLVFQQEFFKPVSQVRVSVQADLLDNNTGVILGSRRFVAVADAPSNNPYGGVQAANQAVRQINQEIAAFVLEQIKSKRSSLIRLEK